MKADIQRYQSRKEVGIIYSLAMILLPAQAAVYYLVSLFIDLPWVEPILGVTLIGMVILNYFALPDVPEYDGRLVMTQKEGGFLFSLELDDDPESFIDRPSITFKVERND